jgi:hypothetical protein
MAAEPPLVVDRAEGTDLVDLDGRRYIDGVSSLCSRSTRSSSAWATGSRSRPGAAARSSGRWATSLS